VTEKTPLAPGDVLVNNAFGWSSSPWRTALIICIDRGKISLTRDHNEGRPASILLLVSGPSGETIIQRSFTWVTSQQWERLDAFDEGDLEDLQN
jgi:hypothetical protein